jgi:hypothetical protein
MSASVIASCAAALAALRAATASAAALPALLAAATLSISSPENYYFCEIPDDMKPSLTGEGMGAIAPADDETPLRYEDAAFLAEAYYERLYMFGTNNAPWVVLELPSPPREIPAGLDLDALRAHGLMDTTKWLTDFEIASGFAVLSTNSVEKTDVVATLAGTNAVYHALATNLWYVGERDCRVLDSSGVAGLYSDLGKTTRRYSKADLYAVGGTNSYYFYEHTDSNITNLIDTYGRDGTPIYVTDATTEYDKQYYDSSDYKYNISFLGEYTKKRSRAVYEDAEYKTVVGAENASSGGTWHCGRVVCPGVAAYIHDNPGWTNIPWVTVKRIRLFGKGTYKRALTCTKNTKGEASTNVTYSVTNGTFVVEIPVDSIKNEGWAFSKMGMGDDGGGIIEKMRGLFGDLGIDGLGSLEAATPEPDATAGGVGYAGANTAEANFQMDISMGDFYVVYELEFNARVTSDGEE